MLGGVNASDIDSHALTSVDTSLEVVSMNLFEEGEKEKNVQEPMEDGLFQVVSEENEDLTSDSGLMFQMLNISSKRFSGCAPQFLGLNQLKRG